MIRITRGKKVKQFDSMIYTVQLPGILNPTQSQFTRKIEKKIKTSKVG